MFAAITFHFLVGSVAGSIFAVRALLTLVALVLMECVGVAFASGIFAGAASLASLIALQLGYLVGIYARSVLEHIGFAEPRVRARHLRQ